MTYINTIGKKAKLASEDLALASLQKRNNILYKIVDLLDKNKDLIIQSNQLDLDAGEEKGLSSALLDRLTLTDDRIEGMKAGVIKIAGFDDPLGKSLKSWQHENGMQITEISVPIGVIGMIYESRPNVTVDVSALAIKSGNCVILRGGSEAIHTNKVLADIIREAISQVGMNKDMVQLVEKTDRKYVSDLITMNDYLDVLIPRGGRGLKKAIIAGASVPVIETGEGLCHTYIDASCDLRMALDIIMNAKTQRTGVCNAMETLLVHEAVTEELLPKLDVLMHEKNFQVRACPASIKYMDHAIEADELDWETEYLDAILSIKQVMSLDEAIRHINHYGSGHSEAIVTDKYDSSEIFLNRVDAAAVYVNVSTRFTDGDVYGFGGEVGISTQKLHARGPMGIEALTTKKFIVRGHGQIR
ncbi:glutamate-5-semialdehyde dehydrogenase [Acidaminobacter sp. JC074]|uniref:glutamate-5-semialdehyde dehydrogenase n=1 Tax=Acidaminobacter sp. JC074 TaxID=2530199 RepID=UPI001F1178F6|nr:glutamate-5-semialdehyde dehydrogenase [Acidaminobacter sp. JC074]MCH4890774.1 glutamate-5-semialdehyde dehydrogenase [Acidaminobacter sp. JC074]